MKFSTAFLAIPALLAGSALANQCTCPSDSDIAGQDYTQKWDPSAYQPSTSTPQVKKVPKVTPTEENLTSGAAQAVQQLTNQNILPPEVAAPVQSAIESAIKKHSKKKPVAVVAQSGVTTTITLTPTPSVVPTTVAAANGSVSTLYVTQTITALPPGATILSNETLAALDDIQEAINDAIAAVNLSTSDLDAATRAELQTCLSEVLNNGGLPEGYSCISQTGSTSAGLKSTFNNILEQFLGILPSKIIDDIQDAVMPMLSGLLPNEATLLNNINSAISSVVSSLSGNSVTAIEMMQSCYSLAIKQNSNTSYLQCYMSDGGPFDTLNTAMNSVIQQFVGYLPGTVLESVQNLTASTLVAGSNDDISSIGSELAQQLNAALASVTSSLTGNSVTLMQELQACANELLINGNATAAANCITEDPANTARTMVNSVAEQFSGYLPSAFFSDLVSIVSNMTTTGQYTETQIITALDQAFNNANIGPAYTGCFEQVQSCLLDEIKATGNYSSTCPGPVAGCELIGSQNSTSLANTTAEAEVSAATATLNATSTLVESTAAVNATSSTVDLDSTSVEAAAAFATSSSVTVDSASFTETAESSAEPTSSSASSSTSFEETSFATSSTSDEAASSSSSDAASASTTDIVSSLAANTTETAVETSLAARHRFLRRHVLAGSKRGLTRQRLVY